MSMSSFACFWSNNEQCVVSSYCLQTNICGHFLDTCWTDLMCNMQCFSEQFFELNHQHARILESYSSADLCFCDTVNVCMMKCSFNMKPIYGQFESMKTF